MGNVFFTMRGDMGLATLILFIVIVLMATIAAVVLLQAANAVRNQAQVTTEEARSTFSKKLSVSQLILVVDRHFLLKDENGVDLPNPYYNHARVIWIAARVQGDTPVDLNKVILTFQTEDVVMNAKYVDADGDYDFGHNACQTDDPYPWPSSELAYLFPTLQERREENTIEQGKGVNYDALMEGDKFTVVWIDCAGKNEDFLVYPGQTIYIIYVPPGGLPPSTRFSIRISIPGGLPTEIRTVTPDVYYETFMDVQV